MGINGIEIEVGQRWRNRKGETVEIKEIRMFGETKTFLMSNGVLVFTDGKTSGINHMHPNDLVTLVDVAPEGVVSHEVSGHEWIDWAGGECPVDQNTYVEVSMRDGTTDKSESWVFSWTHDGNAQDIVRYRVVDVANEPPEAIGTIPVDTDEPEYTGGSVNYYKVPITHPTTEGVKPYVAECNDIIEALGMTYAEGNVFKAIWRMCAARTLGKVKAGYVDGLYDAEKAEFFSKRVVVAQKKG